MPWGNASTMTTIFIADSFSEAADTALASHTPETGSAWAPYGSPYSGTASVIAAEPLAELDYAVAVDPATLVAPERLEAGTEVRLLAVARFGTTRLLDNLGVGVA